MMMTSTEAGRRLLLRLLPPKAKLNWQLALALHKQQKQRKPNHAGTTSLIINALLLLLLVVLLSGAPETEAILLASGVTTGSGGSGGRGDDRKAASVGNYESAVGGSLVSLAAAAAAAETTPTTADYMPTYQRRRQHQQHQLQQHQPAATAISYANYFGNTNAAAALQEAAEMRLHLQGITSTGSAEVGATANGFVPTTITAAGQHYSAATAATDKAAGGAAYNGATFADYEGDGINLGNYDEDDNEYGQMSPSASFQSDLHGSGLHHTDAGVGAYNRAYFGPPLQVDLSEQRQQQEQQRNQQYFGDYEFEQSGDYRQQQTLMPEDAVMTRNPALLNGNLLHHHRYKAFNVAGPYVNTRSSHQQQQDADSETKAEQPDGQASELQLQMVQSKGHIMPRTVGNGAKRNKHSTDSIKSPSEHYYANEYEEEHADSEALEEQTGETSSTNHILRHLQEQLHQQQEQFAQLQHQVILGANQRPQFFHPFTPHQHMHPGHRHIEPLSHLPQPAITTTVHHTPQSKAAVAGVPLARHVHVTKHVPVTHHQQVLVPFNQSVPIDIPQPVIKTVPRPVPIEVPMHKTIAVPQMQDVKIPVEKVRPFPVERAVPYIVERRVPYRVEKQVATPVYYPYPIKVPIIKTVVHRPPSTAHPHYVHYRHRRNHGTPRGGLANIVGGRHLA